MEINFGAWTPYTIGDEEESRLVDPSSHALVPVIDAVLAARDAAGFSASSVISELSAPCLEARSSIFAAAGELAKELPRSRRRVGDLVEECGSGWRLESARCSSFLPPFAGKRRGRRKESVASHGVIPNPVDYYPGSYFFFPTPDLPKRAKRSAFRLANGSGWNPSPGFRISRAFDLQRLSKQLS